MKNLQDIIQEKLQIGSKTKINDPYKYLAKFLDCNVTTIQTILKTYIDLNVFNNTMHQKMFCTDFEALFMLAMMLVKDNAKESDILYMGTIHYSKTIGKANPYDYSWYEELYDDDKDIDILDQIKLEYKNNEKVKNTFKEIFNFCKDNNLDNYEKFFYFYEELNKYKNL